MTMNPPTTATATRNKTDVTVAGNHQGGESVKAVIELGTLSEVPEVGFKPADGFRFKDTFDAGIEVTHTFSNVPPDLTHCRISRQDNPGSFTLIEIGPAN